MNLVGPVLEVPQELHVGLLLRVEPRDLRGVDVAPLLSNNRPLPDDPLVRGVVFNLGFYI